MKQKLLAALLWISPLQQWFSLRNKKSVRILCYHDIKDADNFEKQIALLCRSFNIISPRDFYQHVKTGTSLPDRPVLITFDDADISVLQKGIPILSKHRAPFVLFAISGLIGTQRAFWWDEPEGNAAQRMNTVRKWKKVKNSERLADLETLQRDRGYCVTKQQMTVDNLRAVEDGGGVIGSHTVTHPILVNCTHEEVDTELANSFTTLCSKKGELKLFAYPNGDWNESIASKLSAFGCDLAFAFNHRLYDRDKDSPMAISRLSVDSTTPILKYKLILSGFHSWLLQLRRR